MKANAKKHTLLDFHYRHHFKSERGRHGEGGNRTGRSGEDLWIDVPVGTVVYDGETNEELADLSNDGAFVLVAKGGRGGYGNARFATPTVQAPDYAQQGEAGETRTLNLELKLIADAGLIGLPNAGKSTLLSKISAAKPKIASYPFTTLHPLLGTVRIDDHTAFVVADIPGLIEGASHGHGLGLQFLRHIERTRILLHLIDVSAVPVMSPIDRYRIVNQELVQYGKGLVSKPQILVATKVDIADSGQLSDLAEFAKQESLPFVPISAATGKGLSELLYLVKNKLAR